MSRQEYLSHRLEKKVFYVGDELKLQLTSESAPAKLPDFCAGRLTRSVEDCVNDLVVDSSALLWPKQEEVNKETRRRTLKRESSNRGGREGGRIKTITGDEKTEEKQTDRNFRGKNERKRDENSLSPSRR
jgi:hypothetical protein